MRLELLALLPLTSAHFLLVFPLRRGFDDDKAPTFPCGGFDTPQTNRTPFPLSGGPVQLEMHHTAANVQVLMALGNGDGAYSIQLVPTLKETGPNDFCLGDVTFPSNLGIKEGDNATIQVVTNGDPDGGLYQCADITFTSTALTADQFKTNCVNSTGVSAGATINANANTTTVEGSTDTDSSSTSSAGPSATGAKATSSVKSGLAAQATLAKWAVGAIGVVGMVAAL